MKIWLTFDRNLARVLTARARVAMAHLHNREVVRRVRRGAPAHVFAYRPGASCEACGGDPYDCWRSCR